MRSCDGAYFPISFATVPGRFPDDEKTCKALCPAAEANLYAYRNPGEDMNQAVSISGQPYSSSPNAFRFRQEFNPSCSCKAAGQTWSDALKSIDDKAAAEQQGDIIVTEESAKKMSRAPAKPAPAPARKGTAAATAPPEPRRTGAPPAASSTPTAHFRHLVGQQADPFGRPDLYPGALSAIDPAFSARPPLTPAISSLRQVYPSNASADPRLARDTSVSSGFGNGLPVSRNLLVMG